jgi:hypothetical protein
MNEKPWVTSWKWQDMYGVHNSAVIEKERETPFYHIFNWMGM